MSRGVHDHHDPSTSCKNYAKALFLTKGVIVHPTTICRFFREGFEKCDSMCKTNLIPYDKIGVHAFCLLLETGAHQVWQLEATQGSRPFLPQGAPQCDYRQGTCYQYQSGFVLFCSINTFVVCCSRIYHAVSFLIVLKLMPRHKTSPNT
jgi:hypothetical protein